MATHSFLDGMQFLRRFIDNPREVGALWPSSSRLAKEMVRDLALNPGDLVIEYGVGTGALTSAIAARLAMTPGARYLGIEQDGEFCDRLRQRFPRLDFVRDRVENVQALRRERGLPAPRAILSGLPVVLMPTLRDVVLEAERSLRPGGEFRRRPAGFAQQVRQDRRKGVIDPGVGERLTDGQRPDRGVGAAHSP